MALATYIPEEVTCVLAGLLVLEGYVDGTFVTVDKDVNPYSTVATPDGTTARIQNEDTKYTITFTLYGGSTSNDALTKLWQLDELTNMGKFPVFIKDNSGTDLFFSPTAWVVQVPSISKGNTFSDKVWTIQTSSGVVNFGNNENAAGIVQDLINIATGALPAIAGSF